MQYEKYLKPSPLSPCVCVCVKIYSILQKKKIVSPKNKSCTLDFEEKELLVLPNHALIFLPHVIGFLALFIVEMQPTTKKA